MAYFRNNLAFIIGIDSYGAGVPPLQTAVNDARRLAQLLEHDHDYSPFLLENPSLGRLQTLLRAEMPSAIGPKDRVLIYFAGHGIALAGKDGPQGYLIPQDAAKDRRDSFLPMGEFQQALSSLKCHHLLVILDCCFAGALRWSSTRHLVPLPGEVYLQHYKQFLRHRAWQAIASAAHDEEALDVLDVYTIGRRGLSHKHSPFALALFDAIGPPGKADIMPFGGDGLITASELALYLRHAVHDVADEQTPLLWPLRQHDKGEFVFFAPGRRLKLQRAPEPIAENNPYRGLETYEESHGALFFGRNRAVRSLYRAVLSNALTVVLGASGTGKSSLVKAGLIPRLRGPKWGERWVVLLPEPPEDGPGATPAGRPRSPIRPGRSPLSALASLMKANDGRSWSVAELKSDPSALSRHIGALVGTHPGARLLLVVDQFEELITLGRDNDRDTSEQKDFLALLARAIQDHGERCRAILTLRSDFEPHFVESALKDLWKTARMIVPAMSQSELREAIERPAAARALVFEPDDVVDRLIGEVAQTPSPLPLLSFTLSEMYLSFVRNPGDNRALSLPAKFTESGGVSGVLRNRAELIVKDLHGEWLDALRRLMLRMVAFEGGTLTARQVPSSELDVEDPVEGLRRKDLVEKLLNQRLLVGGRSGANLEPAHDRLMNAWVRLSDWVRESQNDLLLQRRLTPDANEWFADPGQHASRLWSSDPRLPQLEKTLRTDPNWFNRAEAAFVRASVRRKNSRFRWTVLTIAAVAAGLSLFGAVAWVQNREAGYRAAVVTAQKLVSQSRSFLQRNPQRSLLLAAEAVKVTAAYDRSPVADADQALRSILEQTGGHALPGQETRAEAVALNQKRGWLFSGDSAGVVRMWDAQTPNAPPSRFEGIRGPVGVLAADVSGRWLAAAGREDRDVTLWDLDDHHLPPRSLRGHTEPVRTIVFSNDARWLVTGSEGREILRWDLNKKDARPAIFQGLDDELSSLAIDPESLSLVAVTELQSAFVWDLDRPEMTRAVLCDNEGESIHEVAFSARRGLLVGWGYKDPFVRVWRQRDLDKDPKVLGGHQHPVASLAISPDGRWLASASRNDRSTLVWDLDDLDAIPKTLNDPEGRVISLAFHPRLPKLVAGRDDGTARFWDLDHTDGPVVVFQGGGDALFDPQFNPDGTRLLANSSRTVRVWDTRTPTRPPLVLRGHESDVVDRYLAPDVGHLLTVDSSYEARHWDLNAPTALPITFSIGQVTIRAAAFGSSGQWLALGADDGSIRVWDTDNLAQPFQYIANVPAAVDELVLTPDGQRLVVGCRDQVARVWDLRSPGATPVSFHDHEIPKALAGIVPLRVAVSPNGRWLATGGADGKVFVRDLNSKAESTPVKRYEVPEPAGGLTFSPDNRRLAVGCRDQVARVWDLQSRSEKPAEFRGHERRFVRVVAPMLVAILPDGRLVTAGEDQTVRNWNLSDPSESPLIVRGDDSDLLAAVLRPDGLRLLTSGTGGSVHLWYLDDPSAQPAVLVGQGSSYALAFSSDGRWMVVGGTEGLVRLWTTDLDKMLGLAGRTAGRNLSIREWQQYFPGRSYEETFPEFGAGWDVTAERKMLRPVSAWLVTGALLVWIVYCLLLVRWSELTALLRRGAWGTLVLITLFGSVASGSLSGPVLTVGRHALPSIAEKLVIAVVLAAIAYLCSRLQEWLYRPTSGLSTVAQESPSRA